MTTIDQQLEAARVRAVGLADQRIRAMQRRLRDDGAEDRRTLGIPDPYVPVIPQATGLGMLVGALNRAMRQFARDFAAGVSITDPGDSR